MRILRNTRSIFLFAVLAVVVILSWIATNAVLRVEAADGDAAIRFHRTLQIIPGKQAEAAQASKATEQYLNSNSSEGTYTVYTEMFDNGGQVHWFSDYKDLATLESAFNKLGSDQGYQALIAKSRQFYVAGGLHDTVYRKMP